MLVHAGSAKMVYHPALPHFQHSLYLYSVLFIFSIIFLYEVLTFLSHVCSACSPCPVHWHSECTACCSASGLKVVLGRE